jgi:hypothetical protein
MIQRTLQLLTFFVISTSVVLGQIDCNKASTSDKLVCQFPYTVGAYTNQTALGGLGQTGATSASAVTQAMNLGMATQVSQLPLATASAGNVVVPKGGVFQTFNNLGPVLTERAQPIGKGKVFVGFTASQYVFTDIDGLPVANLPFGFSSTASNGSTTYTSMKTRLSFKVNQVVAVGTVGLTRGVDLSLIVPVEVISVGAAPTDSKSYIFDAAGTQVGSSSNQWPASTGTASGIGDINFNLKTVLVRGERTSVSAGLLTRTPTGDHLNLLGSGAWGLNGYLVYSYIARFSPHAKVAYQWNGSTELNWRANPTDPTGKTGSNQNLPGGVQYAMGFDWGALKRLTVAVDLMGNQYLDVTRLVQTSKEVTSTLSIPTSVASVGSYTINELSTGFKLRVAGNLVLTANVLTQLNNDGFRARPTPMLGISYKF